MHEIEVYIMIDENGDYAISKDGDELQEAYDNDVGATNVSIRRVRVTLNVPAPEHIEVTVNVPAEPTAATVSVK